ncbi:MAG: ribonuclease HI [Clostridiales Family XIII bacterium]|jgi:ribonuclease HI|nr:ribonuclease HI [Clostridiales Family XIII bacterium]
MQEKQTINIYTDGACSGNQFDTNTGGWGAILEYGDYSKELCGGERNTTNNRMELTALIEGLSVLTKKDYDIRVFSDSSYLVDCLRKRWYEKWRQNGWLTSQRKPVENRDLWEKLFAFLPDYEFRYYLIKGHIAKNAHGETLHKQYGRFVRNNGDGFSYEAFLKIAERNNRADELANIGIAEARA